MFLSRAVDLNRFCCPHRPTNLQENAGNTIKSKGQLLKFAKKTGAMRQRAFNTQKGLKYMDGFTMYECAESL